MSGNVRRKLHLQASPRFAVFLVRFDLLPFEARLSEEERDREVVPHRIAGEVQPVQLIPRGCNDMADEGIAWMVPLSDDAAGAVFNPDAIRREKTTTVRPRIRRDGDGRSAGVDLHVDVGHTFRIALESKQPARQREAYVEALHLTPAFETAVRLHRQVEKFARVCSPWLVLFTLPPPE